MKRGRPRRVALYLAFSALISITRAFASGGGGVVRTVDFVGNGLLSSCKGALQGQWVWVVHPYSSPVLYLRVLKYLGARVGAIIDQDDATAPHLTLPPGFSDPILTNRGDLQETIQAIRAYGDPAAILTGAETGVELGDALSTALGTPSNGINEARTDKYLMGEVAGEIPQLLVRDGNIRPLLSRIGPEIGWPAVLKPVRSSGGDRVTINPDVNALVRNLVAMLGQKGFLNRTIKDAVIQPLIDGEEFAVDAVVLGDHIVFTEVVHYDKPVVDGTPTYRTDTWESMEGDRNADLLDYARQLIKKFKIRIGPVHLEVKRTRSGQIRLVELNPRMIGSNYVKYSKVATGRSQVELAIAAYFFPDLFLQEPEKYTLNKDVVVVFIHPHGGIMRPHEEINQLLGTLPGHFEHILFQKSGAQLKPNAGNAVGFVGRVVLMADRTSDSHLELLRQKSQIIQWEEEGRFESLSPAR